MPSLKTPLLIRVLAVCIVLSPALPPASAADAPFDLDEYVVTAAPEPRAAHSVTSPLSVIDRMEIEESDGRYVMDAIRRIPGLFVRKDGILGRQKIEIRGLGSNCRRLQTLLDGRPEKMSLFGCTVTQTLPLSGLERIEVSRGPECVLYGSDAMGGVIHMRSSRRREEGSETALYLSAGSKDTFTGRFSHGFRRGTHDAYLTFDRLRSDGHRAQSAYESQTASLRYGYRFSESLSLELSGKHFDDEGEDPGPAGAPYTRGDIREYRRASWNADLSFERKDIRSSFTVYHNAGEHRFDLPSAPDFWHSKDWMTGTILKTSRTLFDDGTSRDVLTLGYEFRREKAKTVDDYNAWARRNLPARFMNLGTFERELHDVFFFNEWSKNAWTCTLGARTSHDDASSSWETVPQAGLLFAAGERTLIKSKIAKGYRWPKFSELFLFPAHDAGLDPEEVWSVDLGVVHRFTDRLHVSVYPFYLDADRFIQTRFNPDPPPLFKNVNTESYTAHGIETEMECLFGQGWGIVLAATWMHIDDDRPGVASARLGQPETHWNLSLERKFGPARIALVSEGAHNLEDENPLTGKVESLDDFVLVGLHASFRPRANLRCFARCTNLLDEDYSMIPEYPMPGTEWTLGGEISW
jgi:iron complex outermembrane receptor protein